MLLSCGLTAFALETDNEAPAEPPPITAESATPTALAEPESTQPEDTELYPADVQTIITEDGRQIIRTYVLTPKQNPSNIPRDSFTRDGWRYTLTDITERRTIAMDSRSHTEIVEINTETNDLNEIIGLLAPRLEYQSEDGYSGVLALDISSVNCEAAGHSTNSFNVTATREYPHLSSADTSLIPKTITENGRTLTLDSVSWEAQRTVNVDYHDIPESFRAVARYTARASRTVVTGYITTAEYSGEIAKSLTGDTIYTAYFVGVEINPAPIPSPSQEVSLLETTTEPSDTPSASESGRTGFPILPVLIGLAVLAAIAGAAAYLFLRSNVKIYRDGFRVLVAKDKISAKKSIIDLSPLEGDRFGVEIDKLTSKTMNGNTIEVRHGKGSLKHKIAYEGNAYRIEADFSANTIQAIY
jgi:hypothetical protein